MKRCFIPYSPAKTILAALAVAVALLGPAPAHADTSWVHGGNWADDGDNFQQGVIYPTGITSGTTTAQAATMADTIASDDQSVGINFVRIGINPATVSNNWPVAQAYVNELTNDGMSVDLGCWDGTNEDGIIDNFSAWETMWKTVDGVYSGNNMIYYEAFNEPHGYTTSNLLNNVYAPFLGFIHKSQSHLILDGTGYASDVTAVGADSRFNACLLGIHIYPTWGSYTNEASWESNLAGHVGTNQLRTVMTEMGAPATTGLNYGVASANVDVSFIRGICTEVFNLGMGFVYWPSHRANDTFRLFNSPGGGVTNPSLIDELQSGWSPTVTDNCDFNVLGVTDYSIFRPSDDTWSFKSGGGGAWGTTADIAVPADYAGTGKAQMATWRPSNHTWYLDGISGGGAWGTNGDIPVPADYNGTGQAQLTVWRPSTGDWWVKGGNTTHWGTNGDIPVPGYYNGDGHADLAVFRPSNSTWYVYGGATVQLGQAGDIPVPGDYNGCARTQIAVWRPSNGNWIVYGGSTVQYGTNGDVPVPGDYNGGGSTKMAVWRPSNNTWYVNGVGQTAWGTTNDVPLPLPYAIRHSSLGYAQ